MRAIILDTETTGLNPREGHRLVEIGCLELINNRLTGEKYHVYINPERDMPEGAFNVHGLSEKFLREHPPFDQHAKGFLEFIGQDKLVIHNAPFDMKFLNAELAKLALPLLSFARVIDTLPMARQKFPGANNSLDGLCRRFDISNAHREKHGALLDAELLAHVYLELTGGKQKTLFQPVGNTSAHTPIGQGPSHQQTSNTPSKSTNAQIQAPHTQQAKTARVFPLSDKEKARHTDMIKSLKEDLWKQYG